MLKDALQQVQVGVDEVIAQRLIREPLEIARAMQYAMVGGKGLRGFLVCESAKLFGTSDVMPVAAAIEALHAYSLVHDDMPAMDDDALRRGQPTVHVKWDEATAILAGDALQSLAFELLCCADISGTARLELIQSLALAAGVSGMAGGQAMDMAAEMSDIPLTLPQISKLQAGKTGALITWSSVAGARMFQQDIIPLKTYGDALGLAFQIADDVLDVEGDVDTVGKAVRKDEGAGKATFVSLLGLAEAKKRAKTLVEEACDALSIYGSSANMLRVVARYVIERDK